jgi:hypothetical protein
MQSIQVGSLQDGVAMAAHLPIALIVGHNKHDVRAGGRQRGGPRSRNQHQKAAKQESGSESVHVFQTKRSSLLRKESMKYGALAHFPLASRQQQDCE